MIIFWNIKSEYIISCCMVKMKFSPKTYRWIHVKLVAIISIHINIPSDIMAICFMRTIINLILMPCLSMFRVGGRVWVLEWANAWRSSWILACVQYMGQCLGLHPCGNVVWHEPFQFIVFAFAIGIVVCY